MAFSGHPALDCSDMAPVHFSWTLQWLLKRLLIGTGKHNLFYCNLTEETVKGVILFPCSLSPHLLWHSILTPSYSIISPVPHTVFNGVAWWNAHVFTRVLGWSIVVGLCLENTFRGAACMMCKGGHKGCCELSSERECGRVNCMRITLVWRLWMKKETRTKEEETIFWSCFEAFAFCGWNLKEYC